MCSKYFKHPPVCEDAHVLKMGVLGQSLRDSQTLGRIVFPHVFHGTPVGSLRGQNYLHFWGNITYCILPLATSHAY